MLNLKTVGISTTKKATSSQMRIRDYFSGHLRARRRQRPPAFTHISYDDFRIIRSNLIEKTASVSTITNRPRPVCRLHDPQLGHIGLHEAEARATFPDRKIGVASMPMAYVARALETDESRGMMKAVVDKETANLGYMFRS